MASGLKVEEYIDIGFPWNAVLPDPSIDEDVNLYQIFKEISIS
jgi:hypothetical protein